MTPSSHIPDGGVIIVDPLCQQTCVTQSCGSIERVGYSPKVEYQPPESSIQGYQVNV